MRNYFSQIIHQRQIVYLLLLIIVLIPTYFIHTQKYPDWGDDFAQYVYQAQQIHSPSQQYKHVLNVSEYSSPKRSVFFSLALAVLSPTTQIHQYVNLISISYIIAAICFFFFLTKHFNLMISVFGSLCVFYNFLFLRLKSEVVPEFLFIALFCLVLFLIHNKKKSAQYIIPVLLALLFSVRFIGLSLLLAYVVHLLFAKEKIMKQKAKEVMVCLGIVGLVAFCINHFFLTSINNQEVKLYGTIVLDGFNFEQFINNVSMYARYITLFFEQEIPYWMNTIITGLVFSCFAIGFMSSAKHKFSIIHLSFMFYFLFLFFYPYNGDTIKYLIPMLPLLIYFCIYGINVLLDTMKLKYKHLLIVASLGVILLSNTKTVYLAINYHDTKIGPYEVSIIHDLEKVKKIVSPEKTIAFGKPFIINLMCNRHSYFVSEKNHNDVLIKADYFLTPKSSVQELYEKHINAHLLKGDTISLTHFYLVKL